MTETFESFEARAAASEGFEKELSHLDELVHQPKRLAILAALEPHEYCEFRFLMDTTGLTYGNLGSHLGKLEEAELLCSHKLFVDKKPQTRVSLTEEGRDTIEEYWKRMEELAQERKQRRRFFRKSA